MTWSGGLGAVGQCWTPTVSPALRAAPSFSGGPWLGDVTTWAHEMDGAGCGTSSETGDWPSRSAERLVRGA